MAGEKVAEAFVELTARNEGLTKAFRDSEVFVGRSLARMGKNVASFGKQFAGALGVLPVAGGVIAGAGAGLVASQTAGGVIKQIAASVGSLQQVRGQPEKAAALLDRTVSGALTARATLDPTKRFTRKDALLAALRLSRIGIVGNRTRDVIEAIGFAGAERGLTLEQGANVFAASELDKGDFGAFGMVSQGATPRARRRAFLGLADARRQALKGVQLDTELERLEAFGKDLLLKGGLGIEGLLRDPMGTLLKGGTFEIGFQPAAPTAADKARQHIIDRLRAKPSRSRQEERDLRMFEELQGPPPGTTGTFGRNDVSRFRDMFGDEFADEAGEIAGAISQPGSGFQTPTQRLRGGEGEGGVFNDLMIGLMNALKENTEAHRKNNPGGGVP